MAHFISGNERKYQTTICYKIMSQDIQLITDEAGYKEQPIEIGWNQEFVKQLLFSNYFSLTDIEEEFPTKEHANSNQLYANHG